ncbi:CHASE domain-containing protein [Aestuariicella sp. G3-2]|uniref:CHASE domain-containing protein n=1 Tax=Pseudomaricurvus albidus TaxID=2842452 RepID=UPI001C0D9469|nr:CHASE domain-containing protein [Aestuariicella albida]MBU3068678.1 CHASE domain-containing protein [Aestuariicella albida]
MPTTDTASGLTPLTKLHWYHWLVLALSLALTVGAWYFSSRQVQEKTQAQFDFQAAQILELVQERMAKYEEALWAGVAALHMLEDDASRKDWKTFATSLQIENRFPGINGIGVIHYVPLKKLPEYLAWQRQLLPEYALHPAHTIPEYWPITYIEPEASNLKAIGLDMAHEHNRFTAAQKARDTGNATITGPITLVQDSRKTPGFLFYAPWYSTDPVPSTHGDRHNGFLGLVYAPFIMHRLMDGTLENTNRQVNFSIHDGTEELYNELTTASEDYDHNPMFTTEITVEMYGRPWTFALHSSQIFRAQHPQDQPFLILIGGLLIDTLLLFIFLVLVRSNERAVNYANKVTEDLKLRQEDLERAQKSLKTRNNELLEANKELDQFAFVASHDLKAPLRGIYQLSQWIADDLRDKISTETSDYLTLLQSRVSRLERLLDDLLSYSRVGRKEGQPELFCITERVQQLFELLSPPDNFKLICNNEVGDINTLATPLELILRNLIGNAIKHHDQSQGVVTVNVKMMEDFYQFTVEDDGPGIAKEYHTKVFDLFHTLKPRDLVEGSGLGLSVIKKILDSYMCRYHIESDGIRGYRFTFTWPNEQQLKARLKE